MTATWPDMAYAIGVLSRYNQDPRNEHRVALKHLFRYLNGTMDWSLYFGGALGGVGGGGGDGALRCNVNSDYAGCLDDYKLTSGLVVTFGGAVNWRLRKQKSTVQSMNDADYYAFRVGCMRLTPISHLLNQLSILIIPHMFSDSHTLIASIKNRIHNGTAVAHIATEYYLAADIARHGDIDFSYVPTAEMLASCFTKPLPRPAFLKQCAAMGMSGIGLRNAFGNGIGNGLGNGVGDGHVNDTGIGTWNGIGNAGWKQIEWAHLFRAYLQCLIGPSSPLLSVLCLKRTW